MNDYMDSVILIQDEESEEKENGFGIVLPGPFSLAFSSSLVSLSLPL